jgi:hypothetical protein
VRKSFLGFAGRDDRYGVTALNRNLLLAAHTPRSLDDCVLEIDDLPCYFFLNKRMKKSRRFSLCASFVLLIGIWGNYLSHSHHRFILFLYTSVCLVLVAGSLYFYRKGM